MSSIKAKGWRWIWDQAKQLYSRLRGDKIDKIVEPTPILRDRYLFIEQGSGYINNLTGSLFSGQINLSRWVMDFRERLKQTFINEYVLARGGRGAMTQADWGHLGAMLKKQYSFLNNFANDLAAGKLTEAETQRRAKMYFDAARQAYEQGKRSAAGIPHLPAYPGDGRTVCLSNCGCSWDIRETETEWLCTWTLGPTEHCPDCLTNASQWAPLVILK